MWGLTCSLTRAVYRSLFLRFPYSSLSQKCSWFCDQYIGTMVSLACGWKYKEGEEEGNLKESWGMMGVRLFYTCTLLHTINQGLMEQNRGHATAIILHQALLSTQKAKWNRISPLGLDTQLGLGLVRQHRRSSISSSSQSNVYTSQSECRSSMKAGSVVAENQ